jgi:hypothetical protein
VERAFLPGRFVTPKQSNEVSRPGRSGRGVMFFRQAKRLTIGSAFRSMS